LLRGSAELANHGGHFSLGNRDSNLELISETTDLLNSDYNMLLKQAQPSSSINVDGSQNPFEQQDYPESPPLHNKRISNESLEMETLRKIMQENLQLKQVVIT